VKLADLPHVGPGARLEVVYAMSTSPVQVNDLTFGPLGETTRPEETVIWLVAGAGITARHLAVRVNPLTGLCSIESFQAQSPIAGADAAPVAPPAPPDVPPTAPPPPPPTEPSGS
jgi:hypothetical protein